MKFKRASGTTILSIIISITAFLQLQPYFVWNNNYVRYSYIIILFILGYFLIISKSLKIQYKNLTLLLFAIFAIIYINYDGFKIAIINLILTIPLFVYILTSTENKKKIYYYFSYIFAIALLPSIIIYIFHMFNINFNGAYLEPLNPLKTEAGMYYKQYFGAVTLFSPYAFATGKLYRLCGMFDEPGVVGTISALILTGNRYQIKKNYINTILLIGGILSFSLFFYMITLGYYIIASVLEKKHKNIVIGMSLLIIIGTFSTGLIKNDFVNNAIINRMSIKDGKLQGDNRTTEYFEARFSEFLESGINTVMFGMGRGTSHNDKLLEASASWKKFVFDRGLLGLAMLILFLVVNTFMFNKTKSGIILLLVMIASVYQRPGVLDLPNILIFSGGLITQASIVLNNSDFQKTIFK